MEEALKCVSDPSALVWCSRFECVSFCPLSFWPFIFNSFMPVPNLLSVLRVAAFSTGLVYGTIHNKTVQEIEAAHQAHLASLREAAASKHAGKL